MCYQKKLSCCYQNQYTWSELKILNKGALLGHVTLGTWEGGRNCGDRRFNVTSALLLLQVGYTSLTGQSLYPLLKGWILVEWSQPPASTWSPCSRSLRTQPCASLWALCSAFSAPTQPPWCSAWILGLQKNYDTTERSLWSPVSGTKRWLW